MFLDGYSSDIFIQPEASILGIPIDSIKRARTLTEFTVQPLSVVKFSRTSPAWRVSAIKTTARAVTLKIRFELRMTPVLVELFRSLLPIYDFASQRGIVCRTWQPEFIEPVATSKIWLQDDTTGQTYLFEGCAVTECQIGMTYQQIADVTFGLIALKTTHLESDSGLYGFFNTEQLTPAAAPNCTAYFVDQGGDFDDTEMEDFAIPGVTRFTTTIKRGAISPVQFSGGMPSRYSKQPAEFSASIETLVTDDMRPWLTMTERYGALILRYGFENGFWIDALFPLAALTNGSTQLHSTAQDTPVSISVNSISDMTAAGGNALRLYFPSEGPDGGLIGISDNYSSEGYDGGNFADNLIQPQPHIDGGDFTNTNT